MNGEELSVSVVFLFSLHLYFPLLDRFIFTYSHIVSVGCCTVIFSRYLFITLPLYTHHKIKSKSFPKNLLDLNDPHKTNSPRPPIYATVQVGYEQTFSAK